MNSSFFFFKCFLIFRQLFFTNNFISPKKLKEKSTTVTPDSKQGGKVIIRIKNMNSSNFFEKYFLMFR